MGTIHSIYLAAVATALSGCRHTGQSTPAEVAAATGPVVAQVQLTDGLLLTASPNQERWLVEIRDQLQFAVGGLAGAGAIADLDRLEIAVDTAGVRRDKEGTFVPYTARFLASWSKPLPAEPTFALPRGGDTGAREEFFKAFSATCRDDRGSVSPSSYWHRYRPDAAGCPLAGGAVDRTLTVKARFEVLHEGATGSPDFDGMWQDKKLAALYLVEDQRDFTQAAAMLTARFGAPHYANAADVSFSSSVADKGDVSVRMIWTGAGPFSSEVRAVALAEGAAWDVVGFAATTNLKHAAGLLATVVPRVEGRRMVAFVSGRDSFPFVDRSLAEAPTRQVSLDAFAESLSARRGDASGPGFALFLGALTESRSYGEILGALTEVSRGAWRRRDAAPASVMLKRRLPKVAAEAPAK